ncbi:MAG: methyltransferase domain-containing protein [Anaerolineae bacterium]|nr:methyltransferase domain-containing protein [Anaerolineae bacterium]
MNLLQLERLHDSVAERSGWDFSRVRDRRDPVPWEYHEVVRAYLHPDHRVLDVGTGGGERFLRLAPYFGQGLGTDISKDMIATARANTAPDMASKVAFQVMPAEHLDLEDESFDVVLNRHANLCPAEIVRVLRPGGRFITQQVGDRNTEHICRVFGCTAGGEYSVSRWDDVPAVREELRALGCDIEVWGEYDVRYWFLDLESFVFWLKAIPMPEDFSPRHHWQQVSAILEATGTPEGVVLSNEQRLLLVARKSGGGA